MTESSVQRTHEGNVTGRHASSSWTTCPSPYCRTHQARRQAFYDAVENGARYDPNASIKKKDTMSPTQVTVVYNSSPAERKRFDAFKPGDFLVAPLTGYLGIKLSSSEIRFFQTNSGSPGTAHAITHDTIYEVPTAVELTVTR